MVLNKKLLTQKINDALGVSDKDGIPITPTAEMETYADAIITTLTTASITLPKVQGTSPAAPGPVPDLQASNGTYLPPLLPTTWVDVMSSGFPTAEKALLQKEALASTGYLNKDTQIVFGVGTMQGESTAAPGPTPGVLVFTNGSGGVISALSGVDWAKVAVPPMGDPKVAEKVYKAIVKYLQESAEIIFPAGTVNGVFPAPSAPLEAGIGLGGKVT